MLEIVKPDFIYEDERGRLLQLLRCGVKQINLVWTKKGARRGDHYHRVNSEIFYVVQGEIALRLSQGFLQEEYRFSEGDMFVVKPNAMHSFEFLEDTLLLACYDKGVELPDGGKDIYSA